MVGVDPGGRMDRYAGAVVCEISVLAACKCDGHRTYRIEDIETVE